jgi:hypothetical protein
MTAAITGLAVFKGLVSIGLQQPLTVYSKPVSEKKHIATICLHLSLGKTFDYLTFVPILRI